jgi:hypothetical protein
MSSYAHIEMLIIQWAEARKIIPNSSPEIQLLKAWLDSSLREYDPTTTS